MEIEAKFSFRNGAAFTAWLERDQLGPFTLRRPRTLTVIDHYLDSDDFVCLRAGYACRVRRHAVRFTATLKSLADSAPSSAAAVRHREELEVDLAALPDADGENTESRTERPDLAAWQQPLAWPESAARTLALRLLDGLQLRRLATVRQQRHERDLCDGRRVVATLSLDRVSFDRGQPDLYELEAELLPDGREADLAAIVAALRSEAVFTPQARSKLERALQGLSGLPDFERAPDPAALAQATDAAAAAPPAERTAALAHELAGAMCARLHAAPAFANTLDALLRLRHAGRALRPEAPAAAARDLATEAALPNLDRDQSGVLIAALGVLCQQYDARGKPRGLKELLSAAAAEPAVAALGAAARRLALEAAAVAAAAEALARLEAHGLRLAAITTTERKTVLTLQRSERDTALHGPERAIAALWRAAFGRRLRLVAPAGGQRAAFGLRFDATLAESGRTLLSAQFVRLRSFASVLQDNPSVDDIHDARVAARRLRTLLRLFRNAYPRRDVRSVDGGLKRLGDALGRVRDMDVLCTALREAAGRAPDQASIAAVLAEWQTERTRLRGELAAHVRSAEYRDWQQRMATFLAAETASERGSERLCERGPALLWRQHGAVRAAARDLAGASLDELHELRKEVRRLRYLLEALRELLGGAAEDAIVAAVAVQDALGTLHDANELRRRLRDRAVNATAEPTGVVALHDRAVADLAALRRAFDETWPRLGGRGFRRRLGRAAASL